MQNEVQLRFMTAFCKISLFHFDFTISPSINRKGHKENTQRAQNGF